MEWKFRKEFQVMPGVKLQYGKNGIKTEFKVNHIQENQAFQAEKLKHQLFKPYAAANEIKSAAVGTLTSDSLKDLKMLLLAADTAFEETNSRLIDRNAKLTNTTRKLRMLETTIFRFLFKKKIQKYHDTSALLQEEITELQEQLTLSTVSLEIDCDDIYFELYNNINKAFELLTYSKKKWDFTSSKRNNMVADRTAASQSVTRSEISISYSSLPIIKSTESALCFHNMNGGDLYFYPGFLIVYESKVRFDLINYSDLLVECREQQFIESENVPDDAQVVDHTWHKVNKDGSRDKRFSDNYQIPVALYGKLKMTTKGGLNEVYCFSNVEYTQLFTKALSDYISSLATANALLKAFK
ncbi:hypothetical protein KTO58_12095 [Chitinophaga pendula]|uniref:hypothetical protein n=1 Tax=Chitinophaga TaxID=79328 RepID=UPI000BAF3E20|nr:MULTISPECIES: hypothetical protein [Chitinophaga]ASZ12496.1 hypothetical protein CK934_16800 [Chitinophaga sp. MD30]UCJ09901.1 hypothetical protein KTO58_12095 [Chitinophaga pendula]